MSQNLYYSPVPTDKTHVGGVQLRDILTPYGTEVCTLTRGNLEYLRGLVAAKVSGANDLIEAIEKYVAIRVWRAD